MRYLFLSILLLSVLSQARAQHDQLRQTKRTIKGLLSEEQVDAKGAKHTKAPVLPNTAFRTGEWLNYRMHYGFVTGAELNARLVDTLINNKRYQHSYCYAGTVGLADMLFQVRDIYQSYFDPATNMPIKAIRNISENGYRFYNEVTFYHERDTVYSKRSKKYLRVPSGIMDLVSAFYYSRRVTFDRVKAVGDTVEFDTFFDDRIFNLKVVYRGRQTIRTELGRIDCMKFNPIVEKGRVFDTENDVSFWVSADKNYIPIRAEMKLMIGAFQCDLVGYKNLMHPLIIKQ